MSPMIMFFFFKQKTAYEIGLGIPAEPLFRSASNIGISQSTFSVKVLNLFSRSRRKTNKRKSKHSAMLRNKERSEERFSRNAETDLVCRLLLEKKKVNIKACDVISDHINELTRPV